MNIQALTGLIHTVKPLVYLDDKNTQSCFSKCLSLDYHFFLNSNTENLNNLINLQKRTLYGVKEKIQTCNVY